MILDDSFLKARDNLANCWCPVEFVAENRATDTHLADAVIPMLHKLHSDAVRFATQQANRAAPAVPRVFDVRVALRKLPRCAERLLRDAAPASADHARGDGSHTTSASTTTSTTTATASTGSAQSSSRNGWQNALIKPTLHPEQAAPGVVHSYDTNTTTLFDKFPKVCVCVVCVVCCACVCLLVGASPQSRVHLLVLSRHCDVDSVAELTAQHVPALEQMVATGERLVEQLRAQDRGLTFRVGFHAVPSMRRLHMHVISQDFSGAALKRARHWHSFTQRQFFLDARDVLATLRTHGRVPIDRERCEALLRSTALQCHRCAATAHNMSELRRHLAACEKSDDDDNNANDNNANERRVDK